jgi:hypothetical protein
VKCIKPLLLPVGFSDGPSCDLPSGLLSAHWDIRPLHDMEPPYVRLMVTSLEQVRTKAGPDMYDKHNFTCRFYFDNSTTAEVPGRIIHAEVLSLPLIVHTKRLGAAYKSFASIAARCDSFLGTTLSATATRGCSPIRAIREIQGRNPRHTRHPGGCT